MIINNIQLINISNYPIEYEFKEKIEEIEKYIQNMRYTMIGKNGEIGIKEIKNLDR